MSIKLNLKSVTSRSHTERPKKLLINSQTQKRQLLNDGVHHLIHKFVRTETQKMAKIIRLRKSAVKQSGKKTKPSIGSNKVIKFSRTKRDEDID